MWFKWYFCLMSWLLVLISGENNNYYYLHKAIEVEKLPNVLKIVKENVFMHPMRRQILLLYFVLLHSFISLPEWKLCVDAKFIEDFDVEKILLNFSAQSTFQFSAFF